MMGRSHSLSGTTAWAATAATAPLIHVHPAAPALITGLLTTAGAALLPDLDHPEGTIAHTFGPLSKGVSKLVARLSGGHRHATHSFLFAALAAAGTSVGISHGHRFFAVPLILILLAFGIKALHLTPGTSVITASVATVAAVLALKGDYGWLPYSVGVGVLAHLLGDFLTKQGCPLLWPIKRHFEIPIIQRTNNAVEHRAVAPAFAIGTVALLALQVLAGIHVHTAL